MRIAHLFWALGNGGVENMMIEIANQQAVNNEVAIFIINNKIDILPYNRISPKCIVYKIGRNPSSRALLPIIKINYLMMKFHPQIIHSHFYGVIKCVFYPFALKVRTIHNTRNNCSEYYKFKKLFSISKCVYDYTKKQGFESTVVLNGIRTDKFKTSPLLPFHDNLFHFVQVSRLEFGQKGQDILIKAIALLKNRGINNFRIHFVGNGPSHDKLIELSKSSGVEENVIIEGNKSQDWIYNNLCNFHLCIQPSRYEGFGLTVVEAMAAKVPLLVSDIEGPLEIIDHGKLGLTFKSEDYFDLSNKLEFFIKKGYKRKILDMAYEHACNYYDITKTAESYELEYKKLLNN